MRDLLQVPVDSSCFRDTLGVACTFVVLVVVVTPAGIPAVLLELTQVKVLLAVVIVTLAVDTVVVVLVVVGGVDEGNVIFEEVAWPEAEFCVPCFEISDRQATSSMSLSNESFDKLS